MMTVKQPFSGFYLPVYAKMDYSANSVSWMRQVGYSWGTDWTDSASLIDSQQENIYFSVLTGSPAGVFLLKMRLTDGQNLMERRRSFGDCHNITNMVELNQTVMFATT